MIANCPNLIGSVKTVAWGKGAGAGAGYGAGMGYGAGAGCAPGMGMGLHGMAAGCKAVCCSSVLGVGLFPLAIVAAVGFLGYKVYKISNNDGQAGAAQNTL